jgi:hypothetical protein
MDPHHEKQTKQCQDVVGTSKRGRSDKGLVGRHPIPPHHHPSHSSEEEDDRELLKRQTPFERSSHLAICYSKKSKQSTINDNHEAPIYEGNKQSCDPCFVSLPLGLVSVYLSPQEEARGGDSVGQLGLDGIREAYNLQPNQGNML